MGGLSARVFRGALRGVSPRTREGRRREQQFLVVSFLFLVNPARTRALGMQDGWWRERQP